MTEGRDPRVLIYFSEGPDPQPQGGFAARLQMTIDRERRRRRIFNAVLVLTLALASVALAFVTFAALAGVHLRFDQALLLSSPIIQGVGAAIAMAAVFLSLRQAPSTGPR